MFLISHLSRATVVGLAGSLIAGSASAGGVVSTTSFADLPGGVFLNVNQGSPTPTGPFGPFAFPTGAGAPVVATLVGTAMSCPENIGSFFDVLTVSNNPATDPGDGFGRAMLNDVDCPDQSITLDFSEPVRAVGVTFMHWSCGFLAQGNRTIIAFDGPGGAGAVVGTASTQGFAFSCFNTWLDFVGVISESANIRSMKILSDASWTAIDGLAISPGEAAQPCPGDANGDDIVDFNDLNIVVSAFNQTGSNLPGDLDGNGAVDFADLNLVVSNFNTSCEP